MEATEKMILLLRLRKELGWLRYGMIDLKNLDPLRAEIQKEIVRLSYPSW